MKLHREDISLALELREQNCQWKVIAEGLGVNHAHLAKQVERAKREGVYIFKSYGY